MDERERHAASSGAFVEHVAALVAALALGRWPGQLGHRRRGGLRVEGPAGQCGLGSHVRRAADGASELLGGRRGWGSESCVIRGWFQHGVDRREQVGDQRHERGRRVRVRLLALCASIRGERDPVGRHAEPHELPRRWRHRVLHQGRDRQRPMRGCRFEQRGCGVGILHRRRGVLDAVRVLRPQRLRVLDARRGPRPGRGPDGPDARTLDPTGSQRQLLRSLGHRGRDHLGGIRRAGERGQRSHLRPARIRERLVLGLERRRPSQRLPWRGRARHQRRGRPFLRLVDHGGRALLGGQHQRSGQRLQRQ